MICTYPDGKIQSPLFSLKRHKENLWAQIPSQRKMDACHGIQCSQKLIPWPPSYLCLYLEELCIQAMSSLASVPTLGSGLVWEVLGWKLDLFSSNCIILKPTVGQTRDPPPHFLLGCFICLFFISLEHNLYVLPQPAGLHKAWLLLIFHPHFPPFPSHASATQACAAEAPELVPAKGSHRDSPGSSALIALALVLALAFRLQNTWQLLRGPF